MTEREPNAPSGSLPPGPAPAAPGAALGLRLRIWVACLSGALVSSLGLWWVAGTQLTLNADPARVLGWLAATAGLGLVVGAGFSLWLDRGVVLHLRGLMRGLASGRVQELRGLPAASGWGELSELTERAQVLITRQRLSNRAAQDLEQLEAALARALARLESWRTSERWEPLPAEPGTGGTLARELNETFARAAELNEQNLEASSRVRTELLGAANDARESAAQAERGFVEATALLTTVRELQRLGQELRLALHARAAGEGAGAETAVAMPSAASDERMARYRAAVEAALEELIESSNESVEHLGAALRRVQEIAGQVQVVSQRATLVALHAVTLESRLPLEERHGEDLSSELRLLTGEVRAASQHADALAAEVERETHAAGNRMRSLRSRVAPRLEPPVDSPEAASRPAVGQVTAGTEAAATVPVLSDHAARLLERVREMIQDATQKGERLSAAGERASRTAVRLLRRLEDEAREIEGLMVRLSPAGELADEARVPGATGDAAMPSSDLRLLDADETAGDTAPAPDAGPFMPADTASDYADELSRPSRGVREERP